MLGILVLLQNRRQIDDHGVPFAPERMAVQGTGGTPGYEGTIGLKRALVLRALKAVLPLLPAQGRVLVRTPQREGVDPVLVPNQDDLVLPVNSRSILRGNRIDRLAAKEAECRSEPDRESEEIARRAQDGGAGGQGGRLAEEVAPGGDRPANRGESARNVAERVTLSSLAPCRRE